MIDLRVETKEIEAGQHINHGKDELDNEDDHCPMKSGYAIIRESELISERMYEVP